MKQNNGELMTYNVFEVGVRVRGESGLMETRGRSSHIWFRHGVTPCLKSILFNIHLYLQLTTLFIFNILSTCKYL